MQEFCSILFILATRSIFLQKTNRPGSNSNRVC